MAHVCKKTYSGWCLDGTDLNASGVKAIIAVGVIIIVLAVTALLVWVDLRRRSGQVQGPRPVPLFAMGPWPSSGCMHDFRTCMHAGLHGTAAEELPSCCPADRS